MFDELESMAALVESWAGINSHYENHNGLKRLTDLIETAFNPISDDSMRLELEPVTLINSKGEIEKKELSPALSIRRRTGAPLQILFVIHIDTIFTRSHPFQNTTRKEKNILTGPGVLDAKGGLVIMLKALETIEKLPAAKNIGWEIFLNTDEEIGSPGSAPLLRERAGNYRFGLLFEPALADGSLVGARGGSGSFTIVVRGRAAHVGREFKNGRNAFHLLIEFFSKIMKLMDAGQNIIINVGKIEGGGPVNVVADLGIARFNVRVKSAAAQKQVEDFMLQTLEKFNKKEGFELELFGAFNAPPKSFSGDTKKLSHIITGCAKEIDLNLKWSSTGGVCDGNLLAAAGLPNIDTMGARGGGAHSSSEFIYLDSLIERTKLTVLTLLELINRNVKHNF